MNARTCLWLILAFLASACRPAECRDPTGPNLLFIIADDLGLDRLASYGMADNAPPTPHLDSLAASGVRFTEVWSSPTCSPTRANMLTGRYGIHTGIGRTVPSLHDRSELSLDELALPEALCGYETSAVGKWHLGSTRGEEGLDHPNLLGFDWYSGSWANVDNVVTRKGFGEERNYRHWQKVTNGEVSWSTLYATVDTTNDAISRIHEMEEGPWLLWTAYNAPHSPWHVPPDRLHDANLLGDPSPARQFDAAIQAMDNEIGRLLEEVDLETTVVFFVSDNGTPSDVIEEPFDAERGKGSLFEGGIRVPLIVAGPGIDIGVSDALIHTTDLFATALDLADLTPGRPVDGVSFRPLLLDPTADGGRETLFSERFAPNNLDGEHSRSALALRNRDFKLVVESGVDRFYALQAGQLDEGDDLLVSGALTEEAESAYVELSLELQDLIDSTGTLQTSKGCTTGSGSSFWAWIPMALLGFGLRRRFGRGSARRPSRRRTARQARCSRRARGSPSPASRSGSHSTRSSSRTWGGIRQGSPRPRANSARHHPDSAREQGDQ